jgi:hypothetical protein
MYVIQGIVIIHKTTFKWQGSILNFTNMGHLVNQINWLYYLVINI